MMTHSISVAALVLGLAAFGVLAPATAKPAAACRIGPMTLEQGAEFADLVIVGEVISERSVASGVYESTIDIAATLKGRSEPGLTLNELGFLGADCSGGGPRLAEGERVLLFIGRSPLTTGAVQRQVVGYEYGRYVLSDTEAITARGDTAIPVEDFLHRIAAVTGAAPDQLDAALSFVRDEPPPTSEPQPAANVSEDERSQPLPKAAEEDDAPPLLAIGIGAAAAAVLLPALLFGVRRLRRSSSA